MKRRLEQYFVKQNIVSLIGFCLICYFGYHMLMGERSVLRLLTLERKIAAIEQVYQARHRESAVLEDRVSRLRPGSIDPDLLEERARYVLGYVRPDEQIILMAN